MNVLAVLELVIGLVLLMAGGHALVRGAARLAVTLGVPPLVVGLTVVAFGTSAPEAAVSAQSAIGGMPDIAVGNVLGSNIFNVLLILGVGALIAPLAAAAKLVRRDVPIMIAASLAAFLLGLDGRLGRVDGALLLAGILAYTGYLVLQLRRAPDAADPQLVPALPETAPGRSLWRDLVLVLVGLAVLVLGARAVVAGAVALARAAGISELVIGLTIVAVGTSLPEVATSIAATVRGEGDIAVGNVVGSNIFNLLFVLGLVGTLSGDVLVSPAALTFDFPLAIAVAVACLPIFFTDARIDRWEGGLFLGVYIAYIVFLVLDTTKHQALPIGWIMELFVVPLGLVTLTVVTIREFRARRHRER